MIIFAQSLWRRMIHIDDVWLGEYSYWLEKLGYVKSEAMRGFYQAENKLYVYHKLFAYQGAAAIKLFGFNPYVLKSVSLLYVLLCLPVLAFLYRKYSESKTQTLLLWALFLSFFHTMNLGFTFRPEMHLAFWGLLSFACLDRYLDKAKIPFLLLAAFLSGVGIATHLNGVVFTGASVLLLWSQRRWSAGFIFGTIATWGLLFYFLVDVRSLDELRMSYTQLTHWRDVATGKYGWDLILRIFMEQGRYLHSPPEIIYSILLLFLLVPARKFLLTTPKRVAYYTIFLCLVIAEVTHGTNTNYLMYAFPFLLLLSMWAFEFLINQGRKKIAWTAVCVFLIGSWTYDIQAFQSRETMAPAYQAVADFLPPNSKVLAPAYLMFPGLGKFQIQSFIIYRDRVEAGTLEQTATALFNEASQYDIEYIVVDNSNKEFFNIVDNGYGNYEATSTQPSDLFRIYKRK